MSTLYRVTSVIAATGMVAVALITVADVVARYALSAPIHSAMENISYFLALLIVAGYGLVTRDESHISVGILPELMPRFAVVERVITLLVTLGGTVLVTWLLYDQAHGHLRRGQMGETTGLPVGWILMGLVVLSCVAVLFAALNLARLRHRADLTA